MELEDAFNKTTDSALQLMEINKEHQRINGELREENKKLQEDISNYVKVVLHDRKEIDRLNNKIEELMTLYTTEREVKEDYKAIIKEVREYVDKWEDIARYKLLEMLDKENNNGNSK